MEQLGNMTNLSVTQSHLWSRTRAGSPVLLYILLLYFSFTKQITLLWKLEKYFKNKGKKEKKLFNPKYQGKPFQNPEGPMGLVPSPLFLRPDPLIYQSIGCIDLVLFLLGRNWGEK